VTDEIQEAQASHSRTLHLTGEYDVVNCRELEDAIAEACLESDNVVIDFTDVRYIDSAAISALLRCFKRFEGTKISIIAPPGPGPRRVLDLVGLGSVIPIYPPAP
jgi:anti-anti-sigma factor